MKRLPAFIAAAAALIAGIASLNARVSGSPALPPYQPYASELFLSALPVDSFAIEAGTDLSVLTPVFRLSGQKGPFFTEHNALSLREVKPDYIEFLIGTDGESLQSGDEGNESVSRLQIGVLRRKGKKAPVGVTVYTVRPGGVPLSQLIFFQLPAVDKMTEDYLYNSSLMGDELRDIAANPEPQDSLERKALEAACACGALPAAVGAADTTDTTRKYRPTPHLAVLRADKLITLPATADFFTIPKGAEGRQLREAIEALPYPMVSFELDPSDLSLTARLHIDGVASLELARELKAHMLPSLRYVWDGSRYKRG